MITYEEAKNKIIGVIAQYHADDTRYGSDSWASAFFLAITNDFVSCTDYVEYLQRETGINLDDYCARVIVKELHEEFKSLVMPGKKTINACGKAFIKKQKKEGFISL